MRHLVQLILFSFLLMSSETLFAIDCKKASQANEKAICADPNLLAYDSALAEVYAFILNKVTDKSKKALIVEGEQAFIRTRNSVVPDMLLNTLRTRLEYFCASEKEFCKALVMQKLNQYKGGPKSLSTEDSLIISAYFKGNMSDFTNNSEILQSIEQNDFSNTTLFKLDDKNMLIVVGLSMGPYQGETVSFLYNGQTFSLIKYPQFKRKKGMVTTLTMSNYVDWTSPVLTIHERSVGYLYECGLTYYYEFQNGQFVLTKQTNTPCLPKEVDALNNGKITAKDLKTVIIYPAQGNS